jgi:hypothetical protein
MSDTRRVNDVTCAEDTRSVADPEALRHKGEACALVASLPPSRLQR